MSGRTRWVVLAALVGGCALGPRADPSRFFTLTAIDAGAQAGVDGRGPALGLGPVVLPGYLRRISMATRVGPNEVRYAEFDRWAEPLERSVPRILQQNLEPLLGRDRVVLYPWLQSAGVEVAVAVEILRFEPTADGQAELAAQWVVRDGSRSRVLLARESVLREPLAGRDAGAAAAALSRVLAALSSEIAHAVRELPRS